MDHKRQHEIDDSSSSEAKKHQRPVIPLPPPPPSREQPTKITDLDDDCLEKIFKGIDLQNLLNVAVANEWLRSAAGIVYRRKFRQKPIYLQNSTGVLKLINHHSDRIDVFGLKTCLQFLRCLGSSVTKLKIGVNWNKKQCDYIHQYMNKYCAESLVEIVFWSRSSVSNDNIEKPFVNVHTIKVICSDLSYQWPFFTKWFPNIRTLHLDGVLTDEHYIDTPFQHLQNLQIVINRDKYRQLTDKHITQMLLMCCNLQSLELAFDDWQGMTLNTLLNFIKGNSMIGNLKVSMTRYSMAVTSMEVARVVIEHPSLVALDFNAYEFTADDAIVLIQQLVMLEKFTCIMDIQTEYDSFAAQLDGEWKIYSSGPSSHSRIVTVRR